MSQSITKWRAYDILRATYPQVTKATLDVLFSNHEMECYRVGSVDRVSLDDVQRVLRSWQEQEIHHNHHQTIEALKRHRQLIQEQIA